MRGKHPNNKNTGSPGLFSCKSLREFNNFHARYRVVQNLDFIWLPFTHAPFWLLLTYAPKYTRAHARTYRRCVFEKCFASHHLTDNVVELLSAWIAYHTDPLECKLTYGWMSMTEIVFALLKVSGNRQSFPCLNLPSAKNQRRFGKDSLCK